MPKLRRDFLNWRPDAEDFGNEGLTKAENVIHESEGWKPAHLASSGAFTTVLGAAAAGSTILSIVTKPMGNAGDLLSAFITNKTPPQLNLAINGTTITSNTTGHPLSFSTAGTSQEIYAFDVCESNDRVFFVVDARQDNSSPATTETLAFTGYLGDAIFF